MTEPGARPTLGRWTRLGMGIAAAALALVLGVARRLEPDPRGYGTHRQLGLPPCAFLAMTGRPCPSCGMTTAFAWSSRGRFGRSWRANPAGAILAPACVAMIPWLVVGALRGRPWGARTLEGPLTALLVAAVALGLLSWTVRLLQNQGRAL
ncbi:MAG TPA: DUF2752 domain-containing protein [Isosphaeraceae bacterium]|jgi:hypothetical protein|nr:DUF2752 domain-containing protein [Isosphaeraceae bacterium]